MESSPLAVMNRSSAFASWGNQDPFFGISHPQLSVSEVRAGPLGLQGQLHRGFGPDYFNLTDIRGSSPAISLAADLSQNFSLDSDASPRFPTPRRVLFTAAKDKRKFETTPFSLLSSPIPPDADMMDFSPIPLSVSVLDATPRSEIESPIWVPSSNDDELMTDSPLPTLRQLCLDSLKQTTTDRRRIVPRRPSFSRGKGFATSGILARTPTDSPIPPFRLGAGSKMGGKGTALTLSEGFQSPSPPQDRLPGSPAMGHVRRPSNPFLRSRKQVRRSLSMFEHPADVMKSKVDCDNAPPTLLQPSYAVEEIHEPTLPHFLSDDPTDTIPRITTATLVAILDGKYSQSFDNRLLIDCRFEYEYEGGHIDGAISYNDKALLSKHLFQTPMPGHTLVVLHCEYSAHRAPLMARHIRSTDRSSNVDRYPNLTYPELYILDGGYSGFFTSHRNLCYPQNYIEMSDARHQRTCERELGRLKARKGLGRAQTFAFGQREPCAAYSPTTVVTSNGRLLPIDMVGNSPILGEKCHARRTASY